jgi:FMN reductase
VTGTGPRQVVAVSAGMRTPSSSRRLSDALVGSVHDHLVAQGDRVATRTIEVREHALDTTRALLTGVRSDDLAAALAAVESADVLVASTPVYNGSYTGLFKSFTDLVRMDALVGTPVILAATGGSVRHTLAVEGELRPLFAVLQATTVPTGVFAATQDWVAPGVPGAALAARIERAGLEAAALAPLRPGLAAR